MALAAAILATWAFATPAAAEWSSDASRFTGEVWVDGEYASNLPVTAKIGDIDCSGKSLWVGGFSGPSKGWGDRASSRYVLEVLSADEKPGCGTDGARVTFYVRGEIAKPTGIWKVGERPELRLRAGKDFAAYSGGYTFDHTVSPDSDYAMRAFIRGKVCGEWAKWRDTTSFRYFVVLSDELRSGCGREGDVVTFAVAGESARQQVVWKPGFNILHLRVVRSTSLPATGVADGVVPGLLALVVAGLLAARTRVRRFPRGFGRR
ncbi:MAG: hypothetical protein WDA27_00960 [Actinomycetota bacterium]